MDSRLVLWGEISTDRKALIAIHLDEEKAKIITQALPKDEVSKEIQDALFVHWKNGGDFTFPENTIVWEIDANSDTILPPEVKVDRLPLVLQSQHKWSKKLMSAKINQLLSDELNLLEEKANVLVEYDQSLWEKAKAQWEKIASYQKKNEITWEQTSSLKDRINAIFTALKAVKRINNEDEEVANTALVKSYHKKIEDLQAKLIYNDQWKSIVDELKKIQAELKDINIRWNHKRSIYDQINSIFDDLRKYRNIENVTKTQERIKQLTKIAKGLKDSIDRDKESYTAQIEKMQHYTRGKLSEDELKNRFGYILDKNSEKEAKVAGIMQTIAQLNAEIEKENKQQQEREAQKLKREQEEILKQQQIEEKKAASKKEKQSVKEIIDTTTLVAEDDRKTADEILPVADLPENTAPLTETEIIENNFAASENQPVADEQSVQEIMDNTPLIAEDEIKTADEIIPTDALKTEQKA